MLGGHLPSSTTFQREDHQTTRKINTRAFYLRGRSVEPSINRLQQKQLG